MRKPERLDGAGGDGALCAFFIDDDADDFDVLGRVEKLKHGFGIRHLRDGGGGDEADGVNVLKAGGDEFAQVGGLGFGRDMRGDALPGIAGAFDELDVLAHRSSARRGHFEDFAGDDHALYLAGAFPDGAQLDVAIELLHWIIFDEAVTAEELHGLAADFYSYFTGEELGHGGLARDLAAGVLEHGGALGEQARGVKLGGHVGELPLDALEFRD